MKRKFPFLLACFLAGTLQAQVQKTWSGAEIATAMKRLGNTGSVLYIAAHPDDENTRLLAYCANDLCIRTAYLSITRGDGGQNLVGNEQGELLGLIRTQELLAARSVDGAEQYFTRANDFGYSKNPEETFSIWNHDSILSDMVWVIRNYRPDIMICRFATDGSGGHGHHTASAILAGEAFDAAADPRRFAWQLQYVKPWQVKRLYHNTTMRTSVTDTTLAGQQRLDVGTYLPARGQSIGELSAISRSKHASQGFGTAKARGSMTEFFRPLKGDTTGRTPFDKMDVSWQAVPGGERIGKLTDALLSGFQPSNPAASVPALVRIHDELEQVKDSALRKRKQNETRELILACAGIFTETVASLPETVPGDTVNMRTTLVNRGAVPCRVLRWKLTSQNTLVDSILSQSLAVNQVNTISRTVRLSVHDSISNPYWLKLPHSPGLFVVPDVRQLLLAENDPSVVAAIDLEIENHVFRVIRPVQFRVVEPSEGERYHLFRIAPAVTLKFLNDVRVFSSDSAQSVVVRIRAGRDSINGFARIKVPPGWKVQPDQISFAIARRSEETDVVFRLQPPPGTSDGILKAEALIGKEVHALGRIELRHEHIPVQVWFPSAHCRVLRLDLSRTKKHIGYIAGAGDDVPACLQQLGYNVTLLDEKAILESDLQEYETIITGVRAYNTNDWLPRCKQKLVRYMEDGGTLLVQYNTNSFAGPLQSDIGPYPFRISRDRVTQEQAAVNLELPAHVLLNIPNKISSADFLGWIQERGIYFAADWDSRYATPFSMNDPGDKSLKGSTLVADVGKGKFIYTGLAFFRQLPAGVPGAYRLFVNMIELGNSRQ